MTFHCPACNVKLKARPDQAGKRFRCPKCKTVVAVPVGDGTGTGSSQAISALETGSVAAASTSAGVPTQQTAEDNVPAVWKDGDVILDLYEVKGILGEGGFGTVHRVRHRGWNRDLAVKSPRAGLSQSD